MVMFKQFLIAILVVYSLPSSSAIAETWSDDFDSGNLDKWSITGSLPPPPAILPKDVCKIENGKLTVDASKGIVIIIAEMPEWDDYAVECKVERIGTLITDSELKLMFRYTQEGLMGIGYGYGYCGCLEGMLGFWRYDRDPNGILKVTNIPPTFGLKPPSVGTWRIEAKGDNLKFFENDGLVLSITDKAYNKGKAGILVANTVITVDDFLVRTPPSFQIEPQTKLPITWGMLKIPSLDNK